MISKLLKKMIEYSEGSLHDINHFMKVHSFARTIGTLEEVDSDTQTIIEVAAMVHDIACPSLRERYGVANGKLQETEGMILARAFLDDSGLSEEQIDRIVYLVGHHHTIDQIDGIDYQILIEADYLVNADESSYSKDNIKNTLDTVFKTQTGKELLTNIYLR